MECREIEPLLSPYLDGEILPPEKEKVETHLAVCPACRAELKAFEEISQGLKEIYLRVKPPPGFAREVMERIEYGTAKGEVRKVQVISWAKRLGVAAAIAAMIGGGALVFALHQEKEGPVSPAPVAIKEMGTFNLPTAVSPPEKQEEKRTENKETVGPKDTKTAIALSPKSSPGVNTGRPSKQEGPTLGRQEEQKDEGTTLPSKPPRPEEDKKDEEPLRRAFLSYNRHVRSTLLKLEVEDLAAALAKVKMLGGEVGATSLQEVWVWQQEEVILRLILPINSTGHFFRQAALLGKELERHMETDDITPEFNRKLLEYQGLSGQTGEGSRLLAHALARQLEELDGETLEAGKEVVNIWLVQRRYSR